MKKPYLTYALSGEGNLVHIDSVANGKDCGCFCTYCGEPLQAKQGAKRKHHFSHLSGTECEAAYESMLHLLAKEELQKTFYSRSSYYINFKYTSFCANTDCIFRNTDCKRAGRKIIDLKQWYDSCEQEISYDNIRRRSDLKIFSKKFPDRKPIYIEFCVTHASDEVKLHSGNKIIEILIEDEGDIYSLVKEGIVEKTEEINGAVKDTVSFYGFKNKDHASLSLNREVDAYRLTITHKDKFKCNSERFNCRSQLRKKNEGSLYELILPQKPYLSPYYIFHKKTGVKSCKMCELFNKCRNLTCLDILRNQYNPIEKASVCEDFTVIGSQNMDAYADLFRYIEL